MKARAWWLAGALVACDDGVGEAPAEDAAPPDDAGAGDAAPSDAAPADAAPSDAAPSEDAGLVHYTEAREPCADRNPLRNVYYGDLHVHTGNSFDAWVFEVRTYAAEAYRFARGEPIALPPLDDAGRGTQTLRLDRPLDFAAVTDHSEYLAEIAACTTRGAAGYDSATCVGYRAAENDSIYQFGWRITRPDPQRFPDLCRDGVLNCRGDLARDVWQRIQDAAEAAYDRTAACGFTTFVAYEYSGAPNLSNLHRNVIFRNAEVPDLPLSFFEAPAPEDLWAHLRQDCLDRDDGCDVLAIPHNSNWSNGNLFSLTYGGAETPAAQREAAALRARLEPVVEIVQHKGDSECSNGFAALMGAPDELCDFEKLRDPGFADCGEGTGRGAMAGVGCVSAYDFVRNALKRGLAEWQRLGVDPFHLGIIGSTDTHNGTPGAVEEADYLGHWGDNEDEPAERLGPGGVTPGGVRFGPGGLAAVWAVENSRDAIFEALRRREVFGTSGPRIAVRMFAGWDLPEDLCDAPGLVATGYARGVPMGADLPPPSAGAPRLVVQAMRDPGTAERPGTPLQRIQIIKGWVDAEGGLHERVYEVAGDADGGAGVDPDTCALRGDGFDTLCASWRDPDFDPALPAFYYARVVENPSCRWNAWACNRLEPASRPASCTDPATPKTVQERAWTSPIWYLPER